MNTRLLALMLTCGLGLSASAPVRKAVVASGEYEALHLAYNPATGRVTGSYQEYTGGGQFSCTFYLQGKLVNNEAVITSLYPADAENSIIKGTLKSTGAGAVTIKLAEEHGGCWNVQHFAGEPVSFTLSKPANWLELRYIRTPKSWFYAGKQESAKRKAYLVKGDVFCVERLEGPWAFGKYYGKSVTEGWLKVETLNAL